MSTTNLPWINQRKQSLVLAGGGMRLAYQAGCLLALEHASLTFQHVDGTSGGIFNTAMLASGLDATDMCKRWIGLKMNDFMSFREWYKYLKPSQMKGFTDADGIREAVFPNLGIDLDRIHENTAFESTYNVCNFSHKTVEAISGSNVKEDHLIAGVSLPMVMPALKIDEEWYTDAVWIKDANLLESVRQGSEDLWLIWAIGNTPPYYAGALNQYVHMIEMSANGGLWEEFNQIKKINIEIENSSENHPQSGPVRLFVIKPKYPLPLDPDLFFDRIDARSLINMGYADAQSALKEMPKEGHEMNPAATSMKEPGDRLCIRGEFQNKLLWNEKEELITFHFYLRYSELLNDQEIEVFSSICIGDEEIPLFNHQVGMTSDNIVIKTQLMYKEDKVDLVITIPKPFALDLLLGLGFKKIHINMIRMGEELLSDLLYQSTKSRLKSILTTNVRTKNGQAGGQRKKYKMMKNFVTYEI